MTITMKFDKTTKNFHKYTAKKPAGPFMLGTLYFPLEQFKTPPAILELTLKEE